MKKIPIFISMLLLLFGIGTAQAIPVSIDFTSGSGDNLNLYVEDGFRFRPQFGDHFENNYSTAPGVFKPNAIIKSPI